MDDDSHVGKPPSKVYGRREIDCNLLTQGSRMSWHLGQVQEKRPIRKFKQWFTEIEWNENQPASPFQMALKTKWLRNDAIAQNSERVKGFCSSYISKSSKTLFLFLKFFELIKIA